MEQSLQHLHRHPLQHSCPLRHLPILTCAMALIETKISRMDVFGSKTHVLVLLVLKNIRRLQLQLSALVPSLRSISTCDYLDKSAG